jgi:hypothetical protein
MPERPRMTLWRLRLLPQEFNFPLRAGGLKKPEAGQTDRRYMFQYV